MTLKQKAIALLREFKGENYLFGNGVLNKIDALLASIGAKKMVVIAGSSPASKQSLEALQSAATNTGVEVVKVIRGAGSNAPREDVQRMAKELGMLTYDAIAAIGGGSNIDAVKCAECLKVLGVDFDALFGTGQVTALLSKFNKNLASMIAIQTAASSSAHLTKYSNITNVSTGQKKLIIDTAIVPQKAVFDYGLTKEMSAEYTTDGAFDGIGHSLEVFYGAVTQPFYPKVKEIAATGIELIVSSVEKAIKDPTNPGAREALGLGTDLGGYAIMTGGTNGGHLSSFSLVELMTHGRAVGLMNAYYTILFANAIREPVEILHGILSKYGYLPAQGTKSVSNRDLAIQVGKGLQNLSKATGFPTCLKDLPGFKNKDYVGQALTAAKDPALKSKLENMPTPLSVSLVDEYLGSVLRAAVEGDLTLVKTL